MDQSAKRRVTESFNCQAFISLLGATLARIEPGSVEVHLPFDASLTQQNHYIHGGAIATIADVAGGYAAYSMFEPGSDVLTVEFKLNLLAPARGDYLSALGDVVRNGRTLTICSLKVFAHAGSDKILCAIGQQTLMQIRKDRGSPAAKRPTHP